MRINFIIPLIFAKLIIINHLKKPIILLDFQLTTSKNFEKSALALFQFQARNVKVYHDYLRYLACDIEQVKTIDNIPFLPIHFFKTHQIIAENQQAECYFLSSGTSLQSRSKHFIANISLYEKSFIESFKHFYGNFENYCIQALLPSYLENEHSSLIYMINYFIKHSKHPLSGFVNEKQLIENAKKLDNDKVLLIGVSYALLDLAEKITLNLSHYTIMETGGMKGRRKEWTRQELHAVYQSAFQVQSIHSEYGMTELLSQAYSQGNGIFKTPPWLKVLTRPYNEPFSQQENAQTGVIKVIDLANVYSCAFIETADLGKTFANNSFEVLGRIDFEDIRGCNLMAN